MSQSALKQLNLDESPQADAAVERTVEQISILTRRAIVPGEVEIEENPRSRSAKLRGASKV